MSKTLATQYKRNHTRKTMFAGKLMLAYNVPGTPEAGGLAMAMAQPEPLTYTVCVRDPNSWHSDTGIHVMLRDCGHAHKTIETAQACLDSLRRASCSHGSLIGTACRECWGGRAKHARQWSANWYHAHIEDSEGNTHDPIE